MTIPPIPMLVVIPYLLGVILRLVVETFSVIIYVVTGVPLWSRLKIVDRGPPETWRVVRDFLWVPLKREDCWGWDWFCWAEVYQTCDWVGGSEGGQVWSNYYVRTPKKDRTEDEMA